MQEELFLVVEKVVSRFVSSMHFLPVYEIIIFLAIYHGQCTFQLKAQLDIQHLFLEMILST